MYHIVICDDEKQFSAALHSGIHRYAEEHGTEIKTTVYADGADLIEHYPVDADLIFLDIQMLRMDGLKAAEEIRKRDKKVGIIFLTSLSQYALEGYKYQATNFIVKPIQYVRLKAELDRWIALQKPEQEEFLLVGNDTGKYKVFLNSLQYIETFGRKLMLHTDEENIISYKKLKEYEAELAQAGFVRCHSGYLVNLYFVKRVEKLELLLTTGERLPISQPKRKQVMEMLAEYWGDRL